MKTGIITLFLVCLAFFAGAQKVIENPKYGIANSPHVQITKIEITDSFTILTFHVKIPQSGWVAIHEQSYIQPAGDTAKMFMIKAEGIDIEQRMTWEEGKEEISYKLFFPKIDSTVDRLDFGEPVANSWSFYDLEINEIPYKSIVPKELSGNWFSTNDGNWCFSFFESMAVFESKSWEYIACVPEDNLFKISLKSGKEERMLFVKLANEETCLISNSPNSMLSFSRKIVQNNPPDEAFDEQVLKPGIVVYRGFINGFLKRLGTNTGIIRFNNPLTNKPESHLIRIDDNGSFEAEFPLDFPQEITVSMPLFNERVFFEPNKNLFHLVNLGNSEYPSLFMGENAKLNFGLSATSKINTDQNTLMEGIAEMTESEYIKHIKTIAENERKALKEIQKEKSVCGKAMQIRNLDIDFRMAVNALQFNQNRRFALYMSNLKLNEDARVPFVMEKTNIENLHFLKDLPLNKKTSLLSSEYFNLLSTCRYIDLARPQGMYYHTLGLFGKQLEKEGIKLSGEESDMFDFVKTNLEENFSDEASRNFNKSYGQIMRDLQQKHLDVHNQLIVQEMLENFKINMKKIFGIENGLAMDIISTQSFLASLTSEKLNEEEFAKVKSTVKTDYLKELVISSYYERKAELTVKNVPAEYVPKTDAEKFFDGLIKKYRGKVIYVDFWATWCGPCRAGIAQIKPLKEKLAKEAIVFVYITNPTSPEADYRKAIPDIKGEHFKVSVDEWNLLISKFNIYGIPHYALVDRSGRVINPHLMHMDNEPLKKLLLDVANK